MKKFKKLYSGLVMALAVMLFAACPLLFSACSSDRDTNSDSNQDEATYGESFLFIDGFEMDENEVDYTPVVGDVYELVGVWGNGGVPGFLVLFLELYQGATMIFTSETAVVMIDPPDIGGGRDYGTYTIVDNKVILDNLAFADDFTTECVIKGQNLISHNTNDEVTTVNGGVAATGLVFHLKEKTAA